MQASNRSAGTLPAEIPVFPHTLGSFRTKAQRQLGLPASSLPTHLWHSSDSLCGFDSEGRIRQVAFGYRGSPESEKEVKRAE